MNIQASNLRVNSQSELRAVDDIVIAISLAQAHHAMHGAEQWTNLLAFLHKAGICKSPCEKAMISKDRHCEFFHLPPKANQHRQGAQKGTSKAL